ncbi:MAG: helix-hairpin-helix domain-containing protein [bacterium]
MIVKRIISKTLKLFGARCVIYLVIAFTGSLVLNHKILAGLEDMPVGARALAMGSSYVAVANTADALFLNPGGLSQISGTEISLFYQKPFGLEDLNFGAAIVSLPIWNQRFSFGLSAFGNTLYREQMFILAYSHNYQRKLFYGVSLKYQSIYIDEYGSTATLGLDLGLLVPITSQLKWGFHTRNMNRPSVGQSDEKLPQSFDTGISVQPNPRLMVNFEIFKDVRFAQEVRFGVEFKPFENLALRTGMADNPSRFSAGFGMSLNVLRVDYAFFTHNDLGLTHQMSISIHLGKMAPRGASEKKPIVNILDEHSKPQKQEAEEVVQEISKADFQKININSATLEQLRTLPGVGERLANRIIDFRNKNGAFHRLEDLLKVPGIGNKTLEKIRDKIIVSSQRRVEETLRRFKHSN